MGLRIIKLKKARAAVAKKRLDRKLFWNITYTINRTVGGIGWWRGKPPDDL